nr:hydroxymethylbilane synthase [Chitinophagaceae bacterium]
AQAGLERIDLRPEHSIVLDWMLPAPAQGAIMIVARSNDENALAACHKLNNRNAALCTYIERSFLRGLMGGCSTPVSALATIDNNRIHFRGNIYSPDGTKHVEIEKEASMPDSEDLGFRCAEEVLNNGGTAINAMIREQIKIPT